MVSVWPAIETASVNWANVSENGFTAPGATSDIAGSLGPPLYLLDVTNPGARSFLWSQLYSNFYKNGIRHFWLDEDEGGRISGDSPHLDYYMGSGPEYGLLYPFLDQMTIAQGQEDASKTFVGLSLSRSSWAGSQRFPSVVWSGDIGFVFVYIHYLPL